MQETSRKVRRRPWRHSESDRRRTKRVILTSTSGWRHCLEAFAVWLEEDRRLELSSIAVRVASARTFVQMLPQRAARGVATLKKIDIADVEDVFVKYTRDHGAAACRSMQAAMRLFLRFAAIRQWVKEDLSGAVPSLRSYRLSSIPRGISDESLRRLLALKKQMSARDRTVVLLLAVYGIRRGQITDLRLEDIDWREKTISFPAHKGGKSVHHVLVPIVAEAIAEYLREERPHSDASNLLIRKYSPFIPLSPGAVMMIVRRWLREAGVECSPLGPHAFRHAFAMRLLASGQSHKTIADLLGHRSLESAAIYAKVDHPRLKEVAVEWVEAES